MVSFGFYALAHATVADEITPALNCRLDIVPIVPTRTAKHK
jgi:hypothetical protein